MIPTNITTGMEIKDYKTWIIMVISNTIIIIPLTIIIIIKEKIIIIIKKNNRKSDIPNFKTDILTIYQKYSGILLALF